VSAMTTALCVRDTIDRDLADEPQTVVRVYETSKLRTDLVEYVLTDQLARQIRTIPVTPPIASAAVGLPSSFPGDPADRLIYATAVEHGWALITKDRRLRTHRHPHPVAIW